MTYNRITLRGYVGGDPDIKYIDPSTCIATFQIATHSDGFVNDEGRVVVEQVTEWHNVLCTYSLAQRAEELVRKGLMVEVEGRLSYRKIYTKKGAQRRYAFILADKLTVLTQEIRPEEQKKEQESPNDPYGIYVAALNQDTENELPF